MAEYKVFSGVVSFPPRDNDNAGGKKVRNLRVKLANSVDNTMVDFALWEDMAETEVSQGDFVIAEGSYSPDIYKGETVHKLNVARIVVLTGTQAEPKASNTTAPVTKKDRKVSY